MRLARLHLTNFRQHADTEILFRAGLTGIIGPNGSGKSTILEAIAWALYGSAAARGTNETLRFTQAPKRARVEVELVFELGGHEYRVVRTLHDAEVFIDGSSGPSATGLGGTTAYLQSRLGMNREEFFNTYFTGQKELQFLANMGATQRARFLNRLLGYERLRVAQDRVRERRTQLRHELEGLRTGQTDPVALEKSIAVADQRLEVASEELEAAERERMAASAVVVEMNPRWSEAQKRRDRARENAHALASAQKDLGMAGRDNERAQKELAVIAEAAATLEMLGPELAELPALLARHEQLATQRLAAQRRQLLVQNEKTLLEELAGASQRMAQVEQAPALLRALEDELSGTRAAFEAAESETAEQQAAWSATRQEVATRLASYRDRARELQDKVRELRKAGPDGKCPTCERPLRKEFEHVVGRLEDEYYALVQDGKWLSQRERQLAQKPAELSSAEQRRDELRATVEDKAQQLARCEQAVQELWTLANERKRRDQRLRDLRRDLNALPPDTDEAVYEALEQRLEQLRALERQAAALQAILQAEPERRQQQQEAGKLTVSAKRRIGRLQREAGSIDWSEAGYESIRAEHDQANQALRRAELHAVEMSGRVQTAEEARRAALRELKAHQKREAQARRLEVEQRHHNELDAALSQLRQDLNARVRPELSELASAFLTEITDGRYTAIEIDDDYNVLVLDEGEQKPVISGGEEDIANLVLRLAISQMIAERAGQQLSILILDEVFGSLDIEHRDNVVQLLHQLEGRFEQVILITHIEGIREGLDNVLRVEYDERTGASRVSEESASGSLWTPLLV